MFWGGFARKRKSPGFIWEKEYRGITKEKYIQYILPLVQEFLRQHPGVVFQYDNAPSYKAKATTKAIAAIGISTINFPPYSPDLSPIENVWP